MPPGQRDAFWRELVVAHGAAYAVWVHFGSKRLLDLLVIAAPQDLPRHLVAQAPEQAHPPVLRHTLLAVRASYSVVATAAGARQCRRARIGLGSCRRLGLGSCRRLGLGSCRRLGLGSWPRVRPCPARALLVRLRARVPACLRARAHAAGVQTDAVLAFYPPGGFVDDPLLFEARVARSHCHRRPFPVSFRGVQAQPVPVCNVPGRGVEHQALRFVVKQTFGALGHFNRQSMPQERHRSRVVSSRRKARFLQTRVLQVEVGKHLAIIQRRRRHSIFVGVDFDRQRIVGQGRRVPAQTVKSDRFVVSDRQQPRVGVFQRLQCRLDTRHLPAGVRRGVGHHPERRHGQARAGGERQLHQLESCVHNGNVAHHFSDPHGVVHCRVQPPQFVRRQHICEVVGEPVSEVDRPDGRGCAAAFGFLVDIMEPAVVQGFVRAAFPVSFTKRVVRHFVAREQRLEAFGAFRGGDGRDLAAIRALVQWALAAPRSPSAASISEFSYVVRLAESGPNLCELLLEVDVVQPAVVQVRVGVALPVAFAVRHVRRLVTRHQIHVGPRRLCAPATLLRCGRFEGAALPIAVGGCRLLFVDAVSPAVPQGGAGTTRAIALAQTSVADVGARLQRIGFGRAHVRLYTFVNWTLPQCVPLCVRF